MYGSFKADLSTTLQEIRDAGLYKNERELTSPQSAHVTTAKAEALNFCANNYLGLANHPTVVTAATEALQEWGFGMASVRFICGTQTLHTQLEARLSDVPRHRGDDPLLLLLRRQRRRVRDAVRRRRRRHLRRAQPRLADRRDPALQGPPAALPQRRHGRPRGAARRRRGRAPPRHRHRRRLLHGRLLRPAGRDLRPGRAVRRAGHGRRLARRRLHRRGRARHPRALRGHGPRRHPHRHPRQGARRRLGRLRERAPRDRRPAAPAVAALPVLQRRRPHGDGRVARRARAGRGLRRRPRAAPGQRHAVPVADDGGGVRPACRDRTRSSR